MTDKVSSRPDRSNGYESIADDFARRRKASSTGLATVCTWSKELPAGAHILELGCGSGMPISKKLRELGFVVAGIDASPSLIAAFHRLMPDAAWACEAVEESSFFGRTFDAILAIGLIFLLPETVQISTITRVGEHLGVGGRFLFTAPHQVCEWTDVLTGRTSRSLGAHAYETALRSAGMSIADTYTDEGENHYFAARKVDSRWRPTKSLERSRER